MTSSLNSAMSGAIVWRIARRSIGRAQISSMQRSRDFARVRGLSAVSTTPSSTAMIGRTDSSVPIVAWAPLIRPPFFRYSSVSSETYIRRSEARSFRTRAISSAETPSFAISRPMNARMPSAIDAPCESTIWISRSGSMPAASSALFIAPESLCETWIATIASAPSAKASS